MTAKARAAAEIFAELRARGDAIAALPADLAPGSLDDAYAIQDALAARQGVFGWKVAPPKPGAEPRCAPLTNPGLMTALAVLHSADLPRGRAELEIAFTFAADVREGADRNAVLQAIGQVHLALEILNTRFADNSAADEFAPFADHQASFGVVLGPGRSAWKSLALDALTLEISVDGAEPHRSARSLGLEQTLEQILWLAGHARSRGLPLRAGTVIITGARVGPLDLGGAQRIVGSATGLAPVALSIVR